MKTLWFLEKPDVAETCSIICIGVFPFRLQPNWLWVLRPAEMLRFESLNRYENLTFTICKIKLSVLSGVTIHVIASQFLSLLKPKLYLWHFCTAISHYLYWYICEELRLVDIWPRTMYWSVATTYETKHTTSIRNKKVLYFFNWQGNILQDNGWSSHNNQQRYNVESPTVCRAVKTPPLPSPSVTGNNGGLIIADTLALLWQTEHTSSPPCKAWGGLGVGVPGPITEGL